MARKEWCDICFQYHRYACPFPRMARRSRKMAVFVVPETTWQKFKRCVVKMWYWLWEYE